MPSKAWLASLLREPLAHFLLIGALIFAINAFRDTPADVAGRTIVITAKDVERLTLGWQRAWQRPPTADELDGLIRAYIKEEVYYREALRLGLDKDDAIVRRRMRQKMEAIAAAAAEGDAPSDADLKALLARDPQRYASDTRLTFEQVYIGEDDPAPMLAQLRAGATPAGAPIALPRAMTRAETAEVARSFGADFADALERVPFGEWTGPIASGFGNHLVRVTRREVPAVPAFDDIRQRLETDWRDTARRAREAAAYQALLDGYTITIERP
jgi:hypothetical protein